MDRPGLQGLLEKVKSGLVDCIVVYKVDRLTRSLADFAQLVELLDKHQVSFVSVTQQFNSTSMGRLTLNVLLSFAQFEREVTAERIRDKVAASKQKGMWMGGVCPIGYKPNGRSLEIDAKQAKVVRDLFSRYDRLQSVQALVSELKADGIKSPRRPLLTGRIVGGGYFEKGHLYNLLKNPIYVGKIRHKGKVYDGEHEGIICQGQFDRIQRIFASQTRRKRSLTAATATQDYRGRVFDEDGQRMLNSSTVKGGKQYRYYVSSKTSAEGQKVSAAELEHAIAEAIARLKADTGKLEIPGANANELEKIAKSLDPFTSVKRIDIKSDGQGRMTLNKPADLEIAFKFRPAANGRKGRVAKSSSVHSNDPSRTAYQTRLAEAFDVWDLWQTNPSWSLSDLATKLNMERSRLGKIIRLRFLSPKIIRSIMAGEELSVGAEELVRTLPPEDWNEQEEWLLTA